MRFLLSLILSSFFFIAPFQCSAGEVPAKILTASIENSTTGNQLVDYSISDGHDIAITYSDHRTNTANQRRFYFFTNFLNTAAFKNKAEVFYETKLVARPNLYCKRIGLKLVFPEHYFW
jgi:hypothetical protein